MEHQMTIQSVSCEDWEVLYVNNYKITEGHDLNPYIVLNWISNYISKVVYITKLEFLSYSVSNEYMEDGLPELFSDIPEKEFL